MATTAIPADVLEVLVQSIQYQALGDNLIDDNIDFEFVAEDASSQTSTSVTSQVNVVAVNDAPVLDNNGNLRLTEITEDDLNNNGNTVAEIIFSDAPFHAITDVDGHPEGIAITNLIGNGTWQFNIGTGWNDVGAVSDTNALLLREIDRLRYVPDGQNGETAFVQFHAWDQSDGAVGTRVDPSISGGTTAFSDVVEVAAITVSDVNDAPVLSDDFNSATASEGNGAFLFQNETVTDVDDLDFDGGSLTVTVASSPDNNYGLGLVTPFGGVATSANDVLVNGIVVGTNGGTGSLQIPGSSGPLVINFNANASAADVQAVFNALAIHNSSEVGGIRTVEAVLTDGDGGTSNTVSDDVNFVVVNDAPIITDLAGDILEYSEGDGAVVIDAGADAIVEDVDSPNFDTGSLTVSFAAGNVPTEDVLSVENGGTGPGEIRLNNANGVVQYEGVTIGQRSSNGHSGNDLVITFLSLIHI